MKPTSRRENQRATGISHSSRLIWRTYRSERIRAASKWEIPVEASGGATIAEEFVTGITSKDVPVAIGLGIS